MERAGIFTGKRIDSVDSISHQISVMETKKRISGRMAKHTYFLDDMRQLRESQTRRALKTSALETKELPKFRIRGLS